MRNVKTEHPDGTFSGHFELNDGSKIHYNPGEENLCFWQAACQSQKKYDDRQELLNDSKALKENAYREMNPTVLHELHQKQNEHVVKNGSNIFSLTGGGSGKVRKGPNQKEPQKAKEEKETGLKDKK
jgi:hypothetical protein